MKNSTQTITSTLSRLSSGAALKWMRSSNATEEQIVATDMLVAKAANKLSAFLLIAVAVSFNSWADDGIYLLLGAERLHFVGRQWRRALAAGQAEPEGAAFAFFAEHAHLAAVFFDDRFADGQTESGAAFL